MPICSCIIRQIQCLVRYLRAILMWDLCSVERFEPLAQIDGFMQISAVAERVQAANRSLPGDAPDRFVLNQRDKGFSKAPAQNDPVGPPVKGLDRRIPAARSALAHCAAPGMKAGRESLMLSPALRWHASNQGDRDR